jgi:hypothetical protein
MRGGKAAVVCSYCKISLTRQPHFEIAGSNRTLCHSCYIKALLGNNNNNNNNNNNDNPQ